MNVKANLLSEKQVEIYKLINGSKEPKDEKTNKLVLNSNDKKKYVVHIRTLQFYLKHGLKLKKVHRAIKFEQKEILKPYIQFNTEKRKNARNEKPIFIGMSILDLSKQHMYKFYYDVL